MFQFQNLLMAFITAFMPCPAMSAVPHLDVSRVHLHFHSGPRCQWRRVVVGEYLDAATLVDVGKVQRGQIEAFRGQRQQLFPLDQHQCANRLAAFQQALEIGRLGEDVHEEGRRVVETRLAEIVTLDCLGSNQAQFHVSLGSSKARECLPFEHIFKPEEHMPESAF